ncbi:MAG: Rpn family recombination-promoting nuclease/putative transposase [Bacteroidales bacterium]|nr:Rpn family recombination-promoting nuclease/putative transposase [Bacteroidales bacterium]
MDFRNIKYLDPKNDLTFRKIFGQNANIMKSFLNSLLPLNDDQYIESLIYQDPALLPEIPELKHSVVDVKCTDNFGRQFIVEMQMYWTNSFKSRMLFNSGKAYVKQLDRGGKYDKLLPVYGLSLVDDIYLTEEKYKDKFYHHYKLAHKEIPNEVIDGIELIFIELPKFTPKSFTEKKITNLWLRFLTEINENTINVDEDFNADEEIKEALEHLQVSAFSKNELDYYDNYWDRIRIERSAIDDAIKKMKEAQKKEEEALKAREKAITEVQKAQQEKEKAQQEKEKAQQEKEKAQQEKEKALQEKENAEHEKHTFQNKMAKMMLQVGTPVEEISKETGLSVDDIKKL